MNSVRVKKLRQDAKLPSYGSTGAAGADLYAWLEESVTLQPGETVFVTTGLSMEIPEGYVGLIYARSGLACKKGLAPANKVGVIDCDYRGEFIVALHNHGSCAQTVCNGDRIAQLVITPIITPSFVEVDSLSDSERSFGGFGSTGY